MYLPYSPRGVFATHERSGFTLVEVMLTMGIIGILASIVIGSLNVQKVFLDSYEQDRQHSVKQLESAMNQYIVETWGMASGTDIPTGSENARAICREGVSDISCVNVDILTPDYIPRIPQDPSETNPLFSGFLVYKSTGRPFIVAAHSGEMPGEGLPDTPGMTVFPTSGLTTTEAGGGASFTIVLSAAPTDDVMIGLSSSDTSEGTVSPASVTFTTADWSSAQNIIVTGVDDALIDGDISFAIVTAAA
jgi:prepilin-type N-terminal cleavage/methylation domain-containing protein